MLFRLLIVAGLGGCVACGGTTTGSSSSDDGGSADANYPESASDAGTLECGDAQCGADQICLYPGCGCVLDSGPCTAPPSCVSAVDGNGSYDCSGADAGPACSIVNPPIPKSCSRVCQGLCA